MHFICAQHGGQVSLHHHLQEKAVHVQKYNYVQQVGNFMHPVAPSTNLHQFGREHLFLCLFMSRIPPFGHFLVSQQYATL
jgi:hypothetical protein